MTNFTVVLFDMLALVEHATVVTILHIDRANMTPLDTELIVYAQRKPWSLFCHHLRCCFNLIPRKTMDFSTSTWLGMGLVTTEHGLLGAG